MSATTSHKDDAEKLDYTLVPFDALAPVVQVLHFGAKKYGRDNWVGLEGGRTRYVAAAFRHLVAHAAGEANDPESGHPHLAHAACCLLFLLSPRLRA